MDQIFKILDKNGNGQIEKEELKNFFGYNDEQNSIVDDMIKELDTNSDNQISKEEFKKMMQKMYK